MTLKELREKRNAINAKINLIIAKADKETEGVLSADQSEEITVLETEFASVDASVKAKERAESRTEIAAQSTGRKIVPPDGAIEGHQITGVKDAIEDDPKRGFANHREFYLAVKSHQPLRPPTESNHPKLKNWARHIAQSIGKLEATAGSDEQSTFSDPYGGFLVPVGIMPGILSLDPDADPLAGRTTNVPMGAPSIEMLYRVDKTHTTSVSGGLTWGRREEAAAAVSSRMETAKFRLSAYSLFGLNYSTEELLRDSPQSVAALIQAGFRTELGSVLMKERLNGTGTGEFKGLTASAAKIAITKETGQAADTIVRKNIIKMRARIWGYGSAVWLANHDCLPTLADMDFQVGTGGTPFWQPSGRDDVPDMLLGRPLFFNEHLETVGDAGDIILVNPTQYLEGVYEPLQSAESIHVRFVEHERAFKFWIRNAGAPWWDAALTPVNGATMSPIITLAARA